METYTEETILWMESFGFCWACGRRDGLQVHHFIRGSSRQKNNLFTTAIICSGCHDDEHRGNGIGLLGWLFLKHHYDREHYSLAEVCRLRGEANTAITDSEVSAQREALEEAGVHFP
jgi:hypothetical protein